MSIQQQQLEAILQQLSNAEQQAATALPKPLPSSAAVTTDATAPSMDAQGLALLEMLRSASGYQGYAPQPTQVDLQQLMFASAPAGVGTLGSADLTNRTAPTAPSRAAANRNPSHQQQHDEGQVGNPGTTSKTRIREKNRQAQRRFRERQRTLVNELRVQVDLLCRAVNDGRSAISHLERENRIMKALLMQNNAVNPGPEDGADAADANEAVAVIDSIPSPAT